MNPTPTDVGVVVYLLNNRGEMEFGSYARQSLRKPMAEKEMLVFFSLVLQHHRHLGLDPVAMRIIPPTPQRPAEAEIPREYSLIYWGIPKNGTHAVPYGKQGLASFYLRTQDIVISRKGACTYGRGNIARLLQFQSSIYRISRSVEKKLAEDAASKEIE